ncbi:MAG: BCD family MFS transporter [Wenzhouxiangella sp.]|jgi:BCD family chlorophyll transporter-like MFS transporter|nr:BCD family MFS transporter [Wenzhouxiangella sp.]
MWSTVRAMLWTVRIALPKVAVGWMFALLTIDFNRVAIFELGIAAIVVTSLLSIHYFMAPFQVVIGRIADTKPLFGYRRTPYLLMGSITASLLFLALPTVVMGMGTGSALAMLSAIVLFTLFGLSMAVIADTYHALLAEVTTPATRGPVISVVWIVMIMSTILATVVMNIVRPEFTPEAMQNLYNLTPLIVIGSTLIGIIGVEKRMNPEQLEEARLKARALAPPGNPLASAFKLLRQNTYTRAFFAFIFLAIFSIFLQENIIEVFGAEVFGMSITETSKMQRYWAGGVLIGMVLAGVISHLLKIPHKRMVLTGLAGAAVAFVVLGASSLFEIQSILKPSLFGMGLFIGLFNVGALALMMEMTVANATGLYMGLWGTAQAIGMGTSSVASGALHTTLIDAGVLAPKYAYFGIFLLEAAGLLLAGYILYRVSSSKFLASATAAVNDGKVAGRSLSPGSAASV